MADVFLFLRTANQLGVILLIVSICIPFYTNSIGVVFQRKKWKEAGDYRKKLIEYDSDPFSQYRKCQGAYHDLWINFISILIFLFGLLLVMFL